MSETTVKNGCLKFGDKKKGYRHFDNALSLSHSPNRVLEGELGPGVEDRQQPSQTALKAHHAPFLMSR
jgi:hypothetical protein